MAKEKDLKVEMHQAHSDLSDEHHIRVEKVTKLREQGIEPWPEFKAVLHTAGQVLAEFKGEEETKHEYVIAGRIVALRGHGKSIFAKIQDRTGAV